MRINQNISALNTHSRLTAANNAKSSSLAKLSSGLRINKAGDDAAGLAISEKMRGQVGGLKQSIRNAQDGISLIQTAEGALSETHSMLNRMRDLAVQASNDTNTDADRVEIQKEIEQLTEEVSRVANNTEFNTMTLLNGNEATKELSFHIGANGGQNIKVAMGDMRGTALGIQKGTELTKENAGNISAAGVSFVEKGTVIVKDATVPTADEIKALGLTGTLAQGDKLTLNIEQLDARLKELKDASAAVDPTNTAAKTAAEKLVTDFGTAKAKLKEVTDSGYYKKDGTAVFNTEAEISAKDIAEAKELKEGTDSINVAGKSSLDLTTQEGADAAIAVIDTAVSKVSEERSKLGSVQNRLDHTINNLTATRENLTAAEARIRDVDMAEEMMEFTRTNILSQASTAMLAQANQMPQSVLQLLG